MLSMLGYMVLRLLVVALTPLAVLLLMREEMLHWLRVPTGSWRLWCGGKMREIARVYIASGGRLKNRLVGLRADGGDSGVVSLFWVHSRDEVAKHPTGSSALAGGLRELVLSTEIDGASASGELWAVMRSSNLRNHSDTIVKVCR